MLTVFSVVMVSYCVTYVASVVHMHRFLGRVDRIDSLQALRHYLRFVSVQMVGALLLMAHLPVIVVLLFIAADAVPGGPFVAVMPMVLVALSARWSRKHQRRCRSLPVTAPFRAYYDEVSHIWEAKALPRFPPLERIRSEGESFGQVDCEVHGTAVTAVPCSRCGTYSCDACAAAGAFGQSRCAACRTRYEQIRDDVARHEVLTRVAGTVITGLGAAAGALPFSSHWGPLMAPAIAAIVIASGITLMVLGMMVSLLMPQARTPALAAAIIHIPLVPIGTGAALFVLYALVTGPTPHPLTAEYAEIVAMTKHRGASWTLVGIAIAVVYVPLYVISLEQLILPFLARSVLGQ